MVRRWKLWPPHLAIAGPMVYLAVQGLRWGEIAGLRVRDLDLLRHRVVIERQRTRGEGCEMVEQHPKTKAAVRVCSHPGLVINHAHHSSRQTVSHRGRQRCPGVRQSDRTWPCATTTGSGGYGIPQSNRLDS